MDEVRFGIVGTGAIARAHAWAIERCSRARLVGVHDAVPERAHAFAKEHGVEAQSDLATFLADRGIDAVTIATPSGAHADVAVPAAQAGKHVFCEKPLEVTVERIDRIIDACEANKVTLGCVFQSRTNVHIRRIREAIDAGRFGRLLMVSFQARWLRTQDYYDSAEWRGTWELDGGGALMNQSIHFVDVLLHLAGPVRSVYGTTDTVTHRHVEVEDNATACIRFVSGAMGTVEASTSCAPGFPRRLDISGEHGSATVEGGTLTRWCFTDQTEEDDRLLEEARAAPPPSSGKSDPMAFSFEGHLAQIQDFVDAVLDGREPMVPGREGRRAVELICAIYESARTGEPVVLGEA